MTGGATIGEGVSGDTTDERHWFEDVADHLGPAYLRYSFTMGTRQEVDFLVEQLQLQPGMRVLDVGCGPGRHSLEFARRGIRSLGLDISQTFVDLASEHAETEGLGDLVEFRRVDARSFDLESVADAAISLCQGAFGLGGPPCADDPQNLVPDTSVLANIARALRPEGRVAVSAFSAYFQVKWLEEQDSFDAATAVNHETTELRDQAGLVVPGELWTTCYTPRELRLLAERAGLLVDRIVSVSPGQYSLAEPTVDSHEFLLLATRADPPVD